MIHLLDPPPAAREACRAGLSARDEHQCGGTAASLSYARRVAAGGPVTLAEAQDALTALRAVEAAEADGRLGDRALAVAALLWGGQAGREWAEGLVAPAPAPVLAAVGDDDRLDVPALDALNALAVQEATLAAALLERLDEAVTAALTKARTKTAQMIATPPAALRASLGGLTRGPQIREAMDTASAPAEALAVVPRPVMAAVGAAYDFDGMLASAFTAAVARAGGMVRAHQAAIRDTLTSLLGPVAVDDLATTQVDDEQAATLWLGVELRSFALTAITNPNPLADPDEGEQADGVVPMGLVSRYLTRAGGGDPDTTTQDRARQAAGPDLATVGLTMGPTVLSAVAKAAHANPDAFLAPAPLLARIPSFVTTLRHLGAGSTIGDVATAAASGVAGGLLGLFRVELVTTTTWRWSGKSFRPHSRLDGVEWDTDDERRERCANTRGEWPGVSVFAPHDHGGCECWWEAHLSARRVRNTGPSLLGLAARSAATVAAGTALGLAVD